MELIQEIKLARRAYIRSDLAKGLADSEKPVEGAEESSWSDVVQKSQDAQWKAECTRRYEKFDLAFRALVRLHMSLIILFH